MALRTWSAVSALSAAGKDDPVQELFDLRGFSVVISGAAGAFGLAVAQELAAIGASASLIDVDERRLSSLEKRIADCAPLCIAVDVRDEDACLAAFRRSFDRWRRIDAFVNRAGLFDIGVLSTCRKPDSGICRQRIRRQFLKLQFGGKLHDSRKFRPDSQFRLCFSYDFNAQL